jgi:hypothetical protein
MYASFYRLLLKADPNDQNQLQGQSSPQRSRQSTRKGKEAKVINRSHGVAKKLDQTPSDNAAPQERYQQHTGINFSALPQLHVNIQLHISPDTSPEQIDRIFESMAKHLRSLSSKES